MGTLVEGVYKSKKLSFIDLASSAALTGDLLHHPPCWNAFFPSICFKPPLLICTQSTLQREDRLISPFHQQHFTYKAQ